jgi:hypothetical protein
MNHNHKNKKLFQEKFQDFEPEMERDIWAGIEMGIKKRKVPFFSDYRRMVMVAAALVLIFFVIGVMLERSQSTEVGNNKVVAKVEENKKAENQAVMPKVEEKKMQNKVPVLVLKESEPKAKVSAPKPYVERVKSIALETNQKVVESKVKVVESVDNGQVKVVQVNLNDGKEEIKVETILEKPKLPEMKAIEAVAATKNTPANDWKTIYVPTKTQPKKNNEGQIIESVAVAQNKEELNTLDLSNFSLNNALVFASHKMEKLANKPLNVYHTEDNKQSHWTYIFKLKGFQITRKVHKAVISKQ